MSAAERADVCLRLIAVHRSAMTGILAAGATSNAIRLLVLSVAVLGYAAFLCAVFLGYGWGQAACLLFVSFVALIWSTGVAGTQLSNLMEYEFARFQCEYYFSELDKILQSNDLLSRNELLTIYIRDQNSATDAAKKNVRNIVRPAITAFKSARNTSQSASVTWASRSERVIYVWVILLMFGIIFMITRYVFPPNGLTFFLGSMINKIL